ncbi:MAG: response regulator [Candidatus Aminicenantes bacterium]|jgi:PAS domain S-box-containing protein
MIEEKANTKPTEKIKIMIVEDELIVARSIENHLRKIGYEVVFITDSGERAIARAAEAKLDLVLMDIKLAGEIDGVEAARQIHDRYNIPVVYLTAYADDETLQRAKVTAPFGYIIKPFEPKKLHTTIEIALYKNNMERKLKESELRFRTLASCSPVGIFETDINGHCIYVNERWCEIAGLLPEQAMRDGWLKALHPEDRPAISNAWYQMVESGGKFTREYRFQTPGGKITWVYGHTAPLKKESNEKTGYIGTITDITLLKKLEDELLTSKKLESIGILAAGIAHDFNNLLSVIMGNLSMIKNNPNITADQENMLKSAEKASAQAAELALKLVTFSKGGWLDRQEVTFSQLIQDTIEDKFHQREALFDINIPGNLRRINGDADYLKQVFANLLLNAVEADKGTKGNITVAASNVDTIEENIPLKKGQYVKITVKDKGIGIPKEDLPKIFDPYFSTKVRGAIKGMGLGLTICYSIIQKHGGHISVISEPGQGTTVEVYLPALHSSPASPDTPVPSRKSTLPAPAGKALVMDDDAVIQDIAGQMLMRLGYEVKTVDEGQQAIEAIKKAIKTNNPFNIVFLGLINKKGPGGEETLRQLRKLAPQTKAIAISGFSHGSKKNTLKPPGFVDVLIKPFKISDLKEVLTGINKKGNSTH